MDGGPGERGVAPSVLLHTLLQPTGVLPASNAPRLWEDVNPSLGSHALHVLSSQIGLGQLSPPPPMLGPWTSLAACLMSCTGIQQGFCLKMSSRFPSPTASSFPLPTPPRPPQGLSSLLCLRKPSRLSLNPTFPAVQHGICPLVTSPKCPSPCPASKRCSHYHCTHSPA